MSGPGHEIVIIRHRGHDDHDEHHGGVWKVAFADFMTAMMAFFLVLWLINASNKETRAAVAAYFNPIKLVDSSPLRKGLREGKDSVTGGDAPVHSPDPKPGNPGGGHAKAPPAVPGDVERADDAAPEDPAPRPPPPEDADAREMPRRPGRSEAPFRDPFAGEQPAAPGPPKARVPPPGRAARAPEEPPAPPAGAPGEDAPETALARQAAEIGRDLLARLAKLVRDTGATATPRVDVAATPEGVLISLTDTIGYGMFRVGSAEPGPEVERVLKSVAAVLRDRPGAIVLRGHTDARAYRTPGYDNWQLSSARAHLARAALLADGIEAARILRVEAHADRALRNPADPNAPENRRIEILLVAGGR